MNPQIAEILSYIRKAGGLNADYKGNPQGNFYERALATLHGVEGEIDALKRQLRDEALAFNHANEVVAKLEADVARLSAPVSDREWNKQFSFTHSPINGALPRGSVNAIIAARSNPPAQPVQKEGE